MVKVKLLKSILVDHNVMPTKHGKIVEIPADQAKEFVSMGLAEEVKAKAEDEKPEADKRAKK